MQKNKFFPEVNGNFAFGCMRLPMKGSEVDYDEFIKMIDKFIETGFNYFDTAHGYIEGKSETAIRDCLSKRYDRDKFLLTNKLTSPYFDKEEDIRPFFDKQLELCGVDYFDFYLMHAQDHNNYPKFKACNAYETAFELKKEGKIKHVGISFHDNASMLEQILTDYPEIEVVQIQLNYVDYLDSAVDSKNIYEVCEKYNKPVLIMEPVKGGTLVNLPDDADKIFRDLGDGYSNASYAIRYTASFPKVSVVLSGMSNMEQMNDNMSFMADFKPLDEREMLAVAKVCAIFKNLDLIPCTGCRYCTEGCPMNIPIPDYFSLLNAKNNFSSWNQNMYYNNILHDGVGKASECIGCEQCEGVCPQHLEIIELLKKVAQAFE